LEKGIPLESDSSSLNHAANSRSDHSSVVKDLLGWLFEIGSGGSAGGRRDGEVSSAEVGRIEGLDGVSFEVSELHHHPMANPANSMASQFELWRISPFKV
jgi:hypothetical protein